MSTVTRLRGTAGVPSSARKLMSFTDNRQDASLQVGARAVRAEVGSGLKGRTLVDLSRQLAQRFDDDRMPAALAIPIGDLDCDAPR